MHQPVNRNRQKTASPQGSRSGTPKTQTPERIEPKTSALGSKAQGILNRINSILNDESGTTTPTGSVSSIASQPEEHTTSNSRGSPFANHKINNPMTHSSNVFVEDDSDEDDDVLHNNFLDHSDRLTPNSRYTPVPKFSDRASEPSTRSPKMSPSSSLKYPVRPDSPVRISPIVGELRPDWNGVRGGVERFGLESSTKSNISSLYATYDGGFDREHKFRPEISPFANTVKHKEPVHQRLYNMRTKTTPKNEHPKKFAVLNPQMHETIVKLLHEDASERRTRQQLVFEDTLREEAANRTVVVNPRSIKVLRNKFEKDLRYGLITRAKREEEELVFDRITMDQLRGGMQEIQFLREEEEDDNFLASLMDYLDETDSENFAWATLHKLVLLACTDLINSDEYKEGTDEVIQLAAEFQRRLWSYNFYRISYIKRENVTEEPLPTFKPTLMAKPSANQGSEEGSIDRFELLYKRAEESKKKQEEREKKRQENLMKECKFSPKINKPKKDPPEEGRMKRFELLYNKAMAEKPAAVSSAEKELRNCTFKPKTTSHQKKTATKRPPGFDKTVSRMRHVNIEREVSEMEKFNKEYKRYTDSKPFQLSDSVSKTHHTEPVMFLDIAISEEQTERMAIYESSNPVALARDFANLHGLQASHQQALELIIRDQLQTLRIDKT
ncbi:hypothetical protein PROFUN_09827 [Planoprotostelium fungivorum]|uniref:Uncharacterized protein n=1 Tax=Planoprotostelium fungivorum TaxID=1890364 RepID=A0A2P6NFN6_9EUKA|nr:hypothetical protein PROFUN_09827 [Planoprotostelium fungivorum]